MQHFSDALTNELIVSRMRRAIRALPSPDLADARKRLSAYEAEQVASEHVRDFDTVALRSETFRRGIAPAPNSKKGNWQ